MAEVFGYKREQASDSDFDVKQLLQAAPVKLAVGDVDLRPYCTSTDQFGLSACAGNATADAVEIVSNIEGWFQTGALTSCPQLSRLFVYAMARTLDGNLAKDEGTYIRSCFEVLTRFGIPAETEWPYDQNKVFVSPSILAQQAALGHKIHSYYRISSTGQDRLDDIVSALRAMKPVVFGTLVERSFMQFTGPDTVNHPTGTTVGGHAMIVVGYIGGKFLVKNSWGPSWRENGFVFFDPEYMAWENTWDLWVPTLGFS